MKILIGYEGSECATAALDDLMRAGLPSKADATAFKQQAFTPKQAGSQEIGGFATKPSGEILCRVRDYSHFTMQPIAQNPLNN